MSVAKYRKMANRLDMEIDVLSDKYLEWLKGEIAKLCEKHKCDFSCGSFTRHGSLVQRDNTTLSAMMTFVVYYELWFGEIDDEYEYGKGWL